MTNKIMKQLFFMLLSIGAFSQTVSLTSNTTYGTNCNPNETPTEVIINGDLNLNGYTVFLKNTNLTITGNLNGAGEIKHCNSNNNSTLCVFGAIQNNPELNGLSCYLTLPKFDIKKDYGYKFEVFDLNGKLLYAGVSDENTMSNLPKQQFVIFIVRGYEIMKIYKL